jgi:predicted ATPase
MKAVADLVEAILASSSTVKLLATSREGIGVPDEQYCQCVPNCDPAASTL